MTYTPMYSAKGILTPKPRVPSWGTAAGFEQAGCAHAAADAHGDHHVLHAAAPTLDERMPDQARTRHAVGVAHGDGAAVDVEPVVGDAQLVAAVDDLHGEGLVQFPQAHIGHAEA
jgi:hypothetical protein